MPNKEIRVKIKELLLDQYLWTELVCNELTDEILSLFPTAPKEEKPKIEELVFDKLDIARVDPEKREFVLAIQLAINQLRKAINELIRNANKE